jgi:lipoprotein-releasing system permease protein
MRFEHFAALRYLSARRGSSRFARYIQWITVGGIALGAGGLLLALSLTSGFATAIRAKLFEFGAHIRLETFGDHPIYRADTLLVQLRSNKSVASAEPVVEMQAMIQAGTIAEGFQIKGIPSLNGFAYLETYLQKGTANTDSIGGKPGIVMGVGLARQLQVDTGRVVTVFALPREKRDRGYAVKQFRVAGIFHTGIEELDGLQGFVALEHALTLSGLDALSADYIQIRLHPGEVIWKADADLNNGDLFPYHTVTVFEYYSNIFAWVLLQEKTVPFVISALVLIAAFNLIGTVLMMVLERTSDIGIMRTFGASPRQILRIFIYEGVLLAALGLLLGFGLSFLFIELENTFHFIKLPEENYYMSTVAFDTSWWHVGLVCSLALLLCTAAAWLPARYASRINPVETLQFGK